MKCIIYLFGKIFNVGMTKPDLVNHWKRVVVHGIHLVSIPTALTGFGIISFPLTQITSWGYLLAPIAFTAAIIEVVGKKYDWFS